VQFPGRRARLARRDQLGGIDLRRPAWRQTLHGFRRRPIGAAEFTSAAPGAQLVMARLTDVLFVQILRAYIMQADPQGEACQRQAGVLRALVDPQVAQALGLMHQQLDHPWTVAELAQRVSMSRTGFAVRFAKLAGITPLDYLRKWRMQKASHLLQQGEGSLEQIARRVGYGSGAAFSKAFKDETGLPPGLYRKEQSGSLDQSSPS
jgi:transcriptional regulator GlxA family with amidase domain